MGIKLFILFIHMLSVVNATEWPKPLAGDCEFYTKLENILHCQDKGVDYLSQYAPYYCEAFRAQRENWNNPLKLWAQKTEVCLQEMLYEQRSNPQFSCKTLEEIAFKTHTACYNEAELCQLKIKDIGEILKVIRIKDYFIEFRYSYRELVRLGKTCLGEWISE